MPTPFRKIRLLAYGDSPVIPSGFATVMRNIFKALGETGRYEIDIFGINDRGNWKNPQEHPYHVYQASVPGEQDPYGRGRFIDIVRGGGLDLDFHWDLIFLLNDPFVLENPIPYFKIGTLPAIRDIQKTHYLQLPRQDWFKTIGYFPVDSAVKPHWVSSAINHVDYPVAYTKYGRHEIMSADLQLDQPTKVDPLYIYHGNNFNDFFPLDQEVVKKFRQDYFAGAVRSETFLVTVVGRNQLRKDIPRAMKIFREFQKRRPDSFLYIHAQESETWGSLKETALQFGLKQGQDWNYPSDFVASKGFPVDILNGVYNASDVHLTTTQGEGWGLPITEAMATKTINIAPNITSIPELFNTSKLSSIDNLDDVITAPIRGIPLKAGATASEWICHGATDLERIRPLTNVDDGIKKLLWVYDHPQEVKKITRRAFQWVKRLDWENIATKWDNLFIDAFHDLQKERSHPEKTIKKWQKVRLAHPREIIPSRP